MEKDLALDPDDVESLDSFGKGEEELVEMPVEFVLIERELAITIDMDEGETVEISNECKHPLGVKELDDADFFNSFEDDFDDSDIN